MKKLLSVLCTAFFVALIAPSCSSDDDFNEVSQKIQLDQTAPETGGDTEPKPGGD